MKRATIAVLFAACAASTWSIAQTPPPPLEPSAPATRPASPVTTRPSQKSAEEMLRQMLQPANQGPAPLKPIPNPAIPPDLTSGPGAVAPGAATQPTQPDGTSILDRVGRITKTADGKSLEFRLDADGSAMSDPPLILLQNRRLSQLEDLVNNSYADLKVRVSGELTEYRGRNYLLITRWSQVQDVAQPLK